MPAITARTWCFISVAFNGLSAERVSRGPGTGIALPHRRSALLDSNFPVDLRRALDIARGFIEAKLEFRWTFQASTDSSAA